MSSSGPGTGTGVTSSTSAESISSLVLLGDSKKQLAKLLCEARSRDKDRAASMEDSQNTQIQLSSDSKTNRITLNLDELGNLVEGLVTMMRETNGAQASGPFPRDSVAKVKAVIESLLKRLINDDPDNSKKYNELRNKISAHQKKQQSQLSSQSAGTGAHSSNHPDSVSSGDVPLSVLEFARPSAEDKCRKFLSLLPEGVVVSKTELLHLCLALGFIPEANPMDDNLVTQLVTKFVAEGFITPITPTNSPKKYMMRKHGHSHVQKEPQPQIQLQQFASLPAPSSGIQLQSRHHHDDDNIIALVNVNGKILGEDTFNFISKKKKAQVVHLGCWNRQVQNQSPDYIVVRSIKYLKEALMELQEVRFLSLRGTWKIVRLPDSLSSLSKLLILDLRACHNLVSLPKEIEFLKNLIHLDLSECYVLEHIPSEISSLSNLRVLKGFIINLDPQSVLGSSNSWRKWCKKEVASSCPFSDISQLKKLEKLTIRTRRMGFPTREDLETLCQLSLLQNLRITWVGSPKTAQIDSDLKEFPKNLKKLEFQTAPHQTASKLLEHISKQKDSYLNKLYIKGGGLRELSSEKHQFPSAKVVRLRYLSNFDVEWDQFKLSFPNLTHLEAFECPHLAFFPCDENGIWKEY